MRTVISPGRSSAARIQRATRWRESSTRWLASANCSESFSSGLLIGAGGVIGFDDARDERMAHHVAGREMCRRDAAHAAQDAFGVDQAALGAARQVDLAHVAGDDRLGAETDARQEHLHL